MLGDGPIGLILAPTRELSQQIYTEAKKFCKVFGISVVCCYGGGSKWEQSKDLEQGTEIVVATPGTFLSFFRYFVLLDVFPELLVYVHFTQSFNCSIVFTLIFK